MNKQELETQAKKKRQEYQDLVRQIKELDSKAQTIVIRSLSKDEKLKYITNGTLNNTIKNIDPNTWNESTWYFPPDTVTMASTSAPFYNMQDNTESNGRISGNMNGYQVNDMCIATSYNSWGEYRL